MTDGTVGTARAAAVVSVRLFAGAAEVAGVRVQRVTIQDGATVDEVFDRMAEQFPALAAMKASLKFAVNQEFVEMDQRLSDGDEMAVIPPVSGG
ncbi:MAG: molybdopterin converting factor subunit 1 [Chloroflexi bacterium]|nr:molybdopterin converting factor subunit 1 [Chloroflexota bacterium]MCY3937683.1 molybdopterin converting factor subunit 1 [Chloroflexota bacterium]